MTTPKKVTGSKKTVKTINIFDLENVKDLSEDMKEMLSKRKKETIGGKIIKIFDIGLEYTPTVFELNLEMVRAGLERTYKDETFNLGTISQELYKLKKSGVLGQKTRGKFFLNMK